MAVHLTGIYRRGAEDAEKTQNIHRKDAKRAKKNIERKNPSRFSQERKLLPDFSVPDRGSVNPRLQAADQNVWKSCSEYILARMLKEVCLLPAGEGQDEGI
jgi:hypothetical protein